MKNRIRELRKKQGKSLAALEELTGMSAQQINRLEKGERRLNEDGLNKLAVALGCRPQDIIALNDNRVALVGEVGAGGHIYPYDDLPLIPNNIPRSERDFMNCEFVDAPPGEYPNGIVALRVKEDSMMPFMPPGTIVYYAERFEGGAPDHCLSALCVVQTLDGRALLKIVHEGREHGTFDLQSYNMVTISSVQLAWCAPVIFIKPCLHRRT